MKYHYSPIDEIRQMDMVDYLQRLGYKPQKIRNNDYWYLSPLRDEREPSFNVNRKLNLWYDHALGKGGSLIDFGVLYHKCTVSELIKKLDENFSFHQPKQTVQQPQTNTQNQQEAFDPKIKVIAAKPLTNPILCS